MLATIAKAALRLDQWLETNLGRPYNALLGIGLVTEIVRQSIALSAKLHSAGDVAGLAFPLLLETALLIHQIGALSHRLENRSEGRKIRRGRKNEAE